MPEPVAPSSTGRAIVPTEIREKLWRNLEEDAQPTGDRAGPDAAAAELDDLVRDQYSIAARVEELHRRRETKAD